MSRDVASQTLFPSAARTATVNSDPIDVARFIEADAFLDVTAASGTTPTLDIKFQSSDADKPTATDWYDTGDSFTQVTTVTGKQLKKLASFGKQIRAVATIAGTTPSYTFELIVIGKE